MSLLDNPISQPSMGISPILTPAIRAEVKNYNSVQCRLNGKNCDFMLVLYREFVSLVMTSILRVL
jgi:pantoate kinase